MREPHKLEPSKKSKIPRRMVFFDSEAQTDIEITDEEVQRAEYNQTAKEKEPVTKEHNPYLICATFYRDRRGERGKVSTINKEYHPLNGPDFLLRFWGEVDAFCTFNEKLYVFAHNAKYDMQVTAGVYLLVTAFGYTVTGFSDSNPFIMKFVKAKCPGCKAYMKLEKGFFRCQDQKCELFEVENPEGYRKKSITVLSSTNFFSQSLKSLGDIFKLPKLDFDHGRAINPTDPAFMEEALIYARRDVEILKVAMLHFIDFVKREHLGNFSMTVAGQAFSAYRSRFLGDTIYIHSDKRALDVERRAYAGGRNECFSYGRVEDWIYYVDINSMYPHVMREKLYPTKLITFWEQATVKQLREQIMNDRLCVADCLIDTTEPIFHVKRGKLIFPTGLYWTSLTTPEIIEAMNRGILR